MIFDLIVIGAGAAGLICSSTAGKRGKKTLLLEHNSRIGKKILISGGGRCNFTNMYASSENYISQNPHFCKSALAGYSQWDFIDLVNQHKIEYFEKELGQLFCKFSSKQIVTMLEEECLEGKVRIETNQKIKDIEKKEELFQIHSNDNIYHCKSLVIATGGLSLPKLGASPFGYQLAKKFGHKIIPTKAGLVPLTKPNHEWSSFIPLSGSSIPAIVSSPSKSFEGSLLFTHRGLSGPSILQISSYLTADKTVTIDLLPHINFEKILLEKKINQPKVGVKNILSQLLPKKLASVICEMNNNEKPISEWSNKALSDFAKTLKAWKFLSSGTEGFKTAEVTLGGVDTNEISSKTMESKRVKGLYFVGEVLDVSGQLGGYNFQWAWASGIAAGRNV